MKTRSPFLLLVLLTLVGVSTGRAEIVLKDEDFSLRFDGRLRAGYVERDEFEENEDFSNDRFLVEKAWFGVNGTCCGDFSYDMTWELRGYVENGSPVEAKNLRILYSPHQTLRFDVGQFKVPYGRKLLISWPSRNSIQLPAAAGSFLPGRDIGLMVQWKPPETKSVAYAGVFTGQGANRKKDDSLGKKLYSVRLETSPLGSVPKCEGDPDLSPGLRLLLGAGFVTSEDSEPPSSDARYLRTIVGKKRMFGFDATAKLRGLFFNVEYSRAHLTPDEGEEYNAAGFVVQGSYYVPRFKLEPRIMYDEFDPTDLESGDREKTFTYGLNFLPNGHRAKILAEYEDHRKLRSSDEEGWKENEFRLLVQVLVG